MILTALLTLTVGAAAALLAIPVVADLLAAIGPRRRAVPSSTASDPRFLVLVPAHDEEQLIGACVTSLRSTDYPSDRLHVCVIADNCSDRTPEIAVSAGATCLERNDTENRGKPHAIAWTLRQLSIDEYDAVVIIDADTVVAPGFFRALSGFEGIERIAIQAQYGTRNRDDNDITWLSSLFADARYYFAFPLKDRAGLNTPLMGNGMCIGREVLAEHGWTAFSITENWELYAQYTELGIPIRVAPDAILYAEEARTLAQSRTQRERWAAGKMGVLLRYGGAILRSRRIGALEKLDAIGELLAPGPVTHVGAALFLQVALLPVWTPAAAAISALIWAGVARQVVYSLLAARRSGDLSQLVSAMWGLPRYLVWRVVVQLRAVKQVNSNVWVKTQRN